MASIFTAMIYSEELAETIVRRLGLSRSAPYNWRRSGVIPDYYADPSYSLPEKITDQQKRQQENILVLLESTLLVSNRFASEVKLMKKINQMLVFRRAEREERKLVRNRPNNPMINFSPIELRTVINRLSQLSDAMHQALDKVMPYDAKQEAIRNLLRSQEVLSTRGLVIDEMKDEDTRPAAWRWRNFVSGSRIHPLDEDDKWLFLLIRQRLESLLLDIDTIIATQ
ncbi:hypothetical protein CLV58_12521 [Spirosoma oryzae]|uniref:Uncharacterized protein n=1 Tax=Spirosoma oryzae TaxID=1469603 RepID=A0A2T0S8K7_9BACT|nr:hypothetical protein [Spirosoma oryzae]PRY29759.1 hypothetical protein CLV58_12521 [Spirosoma oryzae]